MEPKVDDQGITSHSEIQSPSLPPTIHKFKFSSKAKEGDGDVALQLFANADDLNEPIDPEEERKLVRKIDFIILPLIAVNYAFFYIDKTTLSYAAIFGIKDDINLGGTRYSWLSSKTSLVWPSTHAHLIFYRLVLLWLPGLGIPDQLPHATASIGQISRLQVSTSDIYHLISTLGRRY